MIRRTMCCLCLSLVLGILFGRDGRLIYVAMLLLMLCICTMAIFDTAMGNRQSRNVSYCKGIRRAAWFRFVLCLCLFSSGAIHMQRQQAERTELAKALSQGKEITVEGEISRKEEKKEQFIYDLTNVRVIADGKAYPSFGILMYSSNGQYRRGNRLKAVGRYEPFQISRNQGNFNEKQFRHSRKSEFRIYAKKEYLLSANENRYACALQGLRQKMRKVFVRSMHKEDAGVMATLALGDKTQIDQEVKALYQKAGISHILAISGLHVSLLGMGLFGFLQKLGCPRKLAAFFALWIVYSFGQFSGMEVSTGRAVGMFALQMTAHLAGCSYDSLTALAFTAMVQLWENPFLLDYAGFLFSYGAVLGVSLAYQIFRTAAGSAKKEKKRLNLICAIVWRILGKGKELLLASLCIQLMTLPLLFYFYYEAPCYSVLVNCCILPFLGILLFLGLAGGVLGCFLPWLGAFLLKPAGWILAVNQSVCSWCLSFPGSTFVSGKPRLEQIVAYYGILAACLLFAWRRKERRWFLGFGIALICVTLNLEAAQFEINVLDVGQGDGILVQTESGDCFFLDGGSSDLKEVGTYRILPFLKCKGIRSIKGWLVSHADADHVSGLKELLQQGYPVEYLILAQGMVQDQAMEELLMLAQEAGCQIQFVSPGMKFGSKDTVFTVLGPESESWEPKADSVNLTNETGGKQSSRTAGADRNAASLAVAVEHQGFTGIFTGDMGQEQERKLLEQGVFKRHGISEVDFYKAAHHGSNGSNSEELLAALTPKVTVISCGERNAYGHPGKEALKRLEAAGSRIFYTMNQGQVRVRQEGKAVRVWTFLP